MAVSRAVLVTGCSSGIGFATAERLGSKGWKVYATARRLETLADLDGRCELRELDVTDDDSMMAVVEEIERDHGAVSVLVNNAGYSLSGAVESVTLDDARRQFETNLFGLARLTQLTAAGTPSAAPTRGRRAPAPPAPRRSRRPAARR